MDIFLLCISGFHQALKLTVILLPLPPGLQAIHTSPTALCLLCVGFTGVSNLGQLFSFLSVISKQDSSHIPSLCGGVQRLKMTLTVNGNANTSLTYSCTWLHTLAYRYTCLQSLACSYTWLLPQCGMITNAPLDTLILTFCIYLQVNSNRPQISTDLSVTLNRSFNT